MGSPAHNKNTKITWIEIKVHKAGECDKRTLPEGRTLA